MGIRKYKTAKGEVRYAVNIFDRDDGKTIWVGTFKTSDDAKRAFADEDRRIRFGEMLQAHKNVRFSDCVEEYLASLAIDPETVREYRRHLNHAVRFFGNRPVRTISKRDVEQFISSMNRDGRAPSYVRKTSTRLAQLFNAAVAWGYMPSSPSAGKIRSLPKAREKTFVPLTPDEVRRLVAAAPEYWQAAYLTLVCCGLRRNELFGVRLEDLDLERGVLSVRGQLKHGKYVPTKTVAGVRSIPMPSQLVEALRKHLERVPPTEEAFVFPTESGYPVDPSGWYRRVWRPTLQAAGIRTDLVMHDLRKQFASINVREGRSAAYLGSVMGHASPITTLKWYAGVFNDEAEPAAQSIDDWLAKEDLGGYEARLTGVVP